MATISQLEIISPSGEIEFHDLDPAKGVANIGRHPDNDIVIDSPRVALFHAVLDHRQKPYQIMLLSEEGQAVLRQAQAPDVGGQPLAANVFQELHDWDSVEIDGYAIIVMEGVAPPVVEEPPVVPPPPGPEVAVPVPAPTPPALPTALPVGLPARPADQTDEVIVVELSEREWVVDVEQTASGQVTIVNGGDLVASFVVSVEGLDESWITLFPQQVNLYEGGRATVAISMQLPRQPSSTAGAHHLAVVVTSPNYPGRVSRLGATLIINPYYEFAVGELTPKQQTISYRKRTGQVTLPVTNKGNSESPFRFEGDDDERACRFEFEVPGEEARLTRQAEIHLRPGMAYDLPVFITPMRRRLVALRKRSYSYTLTTTLVEGAQMPRSVMGQVKSSPLIGPWLLLLMMLCLAVVVVFLLRPIAEPALAIDNARPDHGEAVTLTYDATRFQARSPDNLFNRLNFLFLKLRLEHQPKDGEWQTVKTPADFERSVGKFTEVPPATGQYRLRADTWLSQLVVMLAGQSRPVLVFLEPVKPVIETFSASPPVPMVGEEVVVSWRVAYAESLELQKDGAAETLQDTELESGDRSYTLEADANFTLVARNSSWEEPVTQPLEVPVNVPTKTPIPTPVIVRFDVDPLTIVEGETVRISWEVTGADTVSIEPVGADFLLQGDVGHQPTTLTNYKLTAIKTAEDGTQAKNTTSKEVFVEPLPTETPVPVPPEIQIFEARPKEVVLGDSQLVTLTWTVAGQTTNIEITTPNLKLSGLEAQDSISVTIKETTLFILTAYNGDLLKSAAAEVTVLEPTPTATPEPPPPPTDTPVPTDTPTPTPTPYPPPVIVYYKAEAANPPADRVTFRRSYETESGFVFEYEVQAGSNVVLSWKATGADMVDLQNFGPLPSEWVFPLPQPVVQAVTYRLMAENPGGTVSAFVKLDLIPRPAPPPPYDLSGKETGEPAVALTWYYDRGFIEEIDGFRIYRADVSAAGDGVFEPVQTEVKQDDWAHRTKFSWTDTLDDLDRNPKRTCGLAYYVVAFYWDVVANKERETNASTNSYYTSLCP